MMLYVHQLIVSLFLFHSSFAWNFDINALISYRPVSSTNTAEGPSAISVVLTRTQTSTTNTITETVTATPATEEGVQAAATTRITTDIVAVPNGHRILGLGPQTALRYQLSGVYMSLLSVPAHCFYRVSASTEHEKVQQWVQLGGKHRCWHPEPLADIEDAMLEIHLADLRSSERTAFDDLVWARTGMTFSGEGGLVERWDTM